MTPGTGQAGPLAQKETKKQTKTSVVDKAGKKFVFTVVKCKGSPLVSWAALRLEGTKR